MRGATMFNFLEGETPAGGGLMTIIMLVAMIALFYFFMYRPQKKQEKETNSMRDSLKVGIIGKIVSIKDETLLLETGRDKVRIRILRSAVRNVDVHAEDAQ